MKKLAAVLMLAFAVIGGAAAISALNSTHVAACPTGSPNC